jgi:hypothetical protein
MDLHQQAEGDVRDILAAHGADLSRLRAWLEVAVPEAGGYWEEPGTTDFRSIDPAVRSGHIRQWAAGLGLRRKAGKPALSTLRLRVVSFAGLHLYTPDGRKIRTRTRPSSRKSGLPMRAGTARPEPLFGSGPDEPQGDSGTLFGHDPDARPYEVSVLMDVDLGTKTLKAAWLAAIDWGTDDKGRQIYYEQEIPPQPMQASGAEAGGTPVPPGSVGPAQDGFPELGDDGEEAGTDPA